MANSDNVMSEKSGDFEDEISDPDLETRLYAEIYYSNETYAEDIETVPNDIESAGIARNSTPSTHVSVPNIFDDYVNSALHNNENHLIGGRFVKDYTQRNVDSLISKSNFGKTHYFAKNFLYRKSYEHPRKDAERCNVREFTKRQRLLAREDLWSVPTISTEHRSAVPEPENVLVQETSVTENLSLHTPENITETNNFSSYSNADNERTNDVSCNGGCRTLDKCCSFDEKEKNRKKKNNKQVLTKAFCGTKKLRRYKGMANGTDKTMESSKYKVVSKKKKLRTKQSSPEAVVISSESDDSILEVPVPPKSPPPVVQLADSDDDCDKRQSAREKEGSDSLERRDENFSACYNIETDSSGSSESFVISTTVAGPSNFDATYENSMTSANINTTENDEPISFADNNLILNCTDVQRSASSLEEIRTIRETAVSNQGQSDDGMTEGEAINWGNIAAGQENAGINQEISTIDESIDRPYRSLYDQLIANNPTGIDHPSKGLLSLRNDNSSHGTIDTLGNDSISPIVNYGNERNERSNRKRQKDVVTSSFKEFNVPEIPKKRSKRNINKLSAQRSLTEYFFKPMSKELQAFYNNPWGGENLDLCDIQSRMPRNPSCWAILDVDLAPPSKRRVKECSRCRTNSHLGKRCPQKSKAFTCYMCGAKGHIETRCPQTMCLTCGHKYTTFRPTCGYCSKLNCSICNGMGHIRENCPDLWRRYHDTITETPPVARDPGNIMKAPQYQNCCNCAKRGHDAAMCRQLRWSQHFSTPTYVSSYTDGPIYHPLHHEPVKDTDVNEDTDIEVVEIPDDDNISPDMSSNSACHDDLLFECGNFNLPDTRDLRKITKRLDTMTNVHLDGLLAGNLKPTFLNTWQSDFVFDVRITRGTEKLVLLVIRANYDELLRGIEKVLLQWLTRSDDEKPYLIYNALPYTNIGRMSKELRTKLSVLRGVLRPADLLKKINSLVENVKSISAKVNQTDKTKKLSKRRHSRCLPKWMKNIQFSINNLMNRRCQLVTSLYRGSWIEGADEIVGSFVTLAYQIIPSKRGISVEQYMDIVYLHNELFTFHASDALSTALEKAISMSQRLKCVLPSDRQSVNDLISTDRHPDGKTIGNPNFCDDSIIEDDNRRLKDRPILDEVNFDNYIPIVSQNPQPSTVLVNVGATEYSPETASSAIAERSNTIEKNLLLNYYGKANRAIQNNTDCCTESWNSLPKKTRRMHRHRAEAAIKLANSLNFPRLRKKADALQMQMLTPFVRVDDIQLLINAINTHISRSQRRRDKARNNAVKHL